MKIFITGASGFVGSNIVKLLSARYEFFAMARTQRSSEKIRKIGATAVMTELGKVTTEDLSGCDMVIHAAAFTKEWGTRQEFWNATVHGTKQLIEVSKKAGVKKFIHISTEAVLFAGQDLNDIDETYPYPSKSKFLYSESKMEAEKIALAANEAGVFEVSVIRPRLVWGPDDQTILPVLVNMIKEKRFMWINGGRNLTSTTHIRNLVEGIECLITNWKPNQIYFITDAEIHTYRDFLTQYVATQGVTPPEKNISKHMIRMTADLVETLWKTFGIKTTPPVTKLAAYMLSSNFTIKHEKASQEINYKPVVTFNDAITELKNISHL